MLTHPLKYIDTFAKAGSDMITVHLEAEDDPKAMLERMAAITQRTRYANWLHTLLNVM